MKLKSKNNIKILSKSLQIKPTPQQAVVKISYEKAMESIEQTIIASRVNIAEYQLKQVVQQVPKELQPKLRLLRCYVQFGRDEPAEVLISDMLKQFPRSLEALSAAAWYYRNRGEGEKALSLLEKAVALNPRKFRPIHNLGLTYSALGRSKEAVEAFNKALVLNPSFGTGYYDRSLILKGKTSEEALLQMEQRVLRGDMEREELGMLHLAIAWAYEGKNIDCQFEHLNTGKKLIAEVHPWSEQLMNQLYNNITGFTDRNFTDAIKKNQGPDDNPIFIAALPRSGTTLLEQILGAHSNLYPVGESQAIGSALELVSLQNGCFEKPYWQWSTEELIRQLPDLREAFRSHAMIKSAGDLRIVDKSLNNFHYFPLIMSAFPKAKIIHLRRHPLDTLLSIYQHYIWLGSNTPWQLSDLAKHYKNHERFMDYWKSLYADNILTIDYEDLVAEPESISKEIIRFCDLPWEETCLSFYKQERTVNTPSVTQVNQPINQQAVSRWKPYAKYLKPAADELSVPDIRSKH